MPLVIVASALGILATIGVGVWNTGPDPEGGGPVARITAPAEAFKLRRGRSTGVSITVMPGPAPLRTWTLRLQGEAVDQLLASGEQPLAETAVAQLSADALVAGETYTVVLEAEDTAGGSARFAVPFLIPDPQYALIPLEEGDRWRNTLSGLAIDRSGGVIASGGQTSGDINVLDTRLNRQQTVHVPLQNSDGFRLSGDGRVLVFTGSFGPPDFARRLGFLDLESGTVTRGPETSGSFLFNTDRTARRVAFQSHFDLDPSVGNPDQTGQFFFYDQLTGQVRQLTNDPGTIPWPLPDILVLTAIVPVLSDDGLTVAFATTATLGLAPPDPTIGVRVFAYDVPSDTVRYVHGFPVTRRLGMPVISDDGHWLTFVLSRPVPPNVIRRAFPARLDLLTGAVEETLGAIVDYPGYDAVAAGDGSLVVISTQDDRDPRVGNADHNMELFVYDTVEERFTQVTETTGGIGRFPNGCPPYQPQVSATAEAMAFGFMIGSGELCRLDGPQRNEEDGFTFRRVRAVRKRPGNRPPSFPQPADARVIARDALRVTFAAPDPDGDPVVFFLQKVGTTEIPLGSGFVDHRDGTATFTWATRPEEAGLHRLRVAAFDEGGGEVVHELTVAICSRIVTDATPSGVMAALFAAEPPAACRDADLNRDQRITAGDLVDAVLHTPP